MFSTCNLDGQESYFALRIHVGQFLGSPLYFINKDYYYAYMSTTKQSFGLAINSITQWFSPATIRVSAEPGVADELDLSKDGRLECSFPERLVLMSNHQVCLYLLIWCREAPISHLSRFIRIGCICGGSATPTECTATSTSSSKSH